MATDIEQQIVRFIPKIESDLVEGLKSAPFSKLYHAHPPISRLFKVPIDFYAPPQKVANDMKLVIEKFHAFMLKVAKEAGTVNLEPSVSIHTNLMESTSEILLGVRST